MPGGDEEYEEFVAGRERQLLRTAYLLCGDWHKAEDAVQAALIKVYLAWSRIDHRNAAMEYARRAVVSALIDDWRRPWRRRETLPGELPDAASVTDRHAATDDRLVIRAALAALPPRQRAVIVLRFFDDLDVAQTAITLGCAPGTVTSQTAKALLSLRRTLADRELAALVPLEVP